MNPHGTGEWKSAHEWPLPETKWTPFYLHANGLLSEHEFWPNEGFSTYEDSPFHHGFLQFKTPPMVESTEICGPIALHLYGSTTDTEVLWFVSLWHIDATGEESLLTRGWLRGSQRALDRAASKPWQPVHLHTQREPLEPNKVYEFDIEVRPYVILLKPGERLAVRIKSADDDPPRNSLEAASVGHIFRRAGSHVSVHHNSEYPSLLLPITKGNRICTFISGGKGTTQKALAPQRPRDAGCGAFATRGRFEVRHATLRGRLAEGERSGIKLVLLRPEEFQYSRLCAAVKAQDELATLGLDCGPRRPKSLVIRAKEDTICGHYRPRMGVTAVVKNNIKFLLTRADFVGDVRKSLDTTVCTTGSCQSYSSVGNSILVRLLQTESRFWMLQ